MNEEGLKEKRPIVIMANSSRYLVHYRSGLIKSLRDEGNDVIAISPIDSSTSQLSNIAIHIPWKINRSKNLNLISYLKSSIRLLLLIRAIKPSIVHSHTLISNLLASLVTSIFGIPCIISFTGLGRLSTSSSFYKFIFSVIIRSIYFLSCRERYSKFSWKINKKRCTFIFQNPNDIDRFKSIIKSCKKWQIKMIIGSGVPNEYIEFNPEKERNKWLTQEKFDKCTFIYCGRLLKSKGIDIFIKLSKLLPEHDFCIYGGFDYKSKDSFSEKEFKELLKTKNLIYKGYVDKPLISDCYKYPILIFPSIYGEGLPRSICEALALEIPVITSKFATCNIFTNELVYISNEQTLESYKICIQKLFDDSTNKQLAKKIKGAKQYIKNQVLENIIVRNTKRVYEKHLDNQNIYLLDKDRALYESWIAN